MAATFNTNYDLLFNQQAQPAFADEPLALDDDTDNETDTILECTRQQLKRDKETRL